MRIPAGLYEGFYMSLLQPTDRLDPLSAPVAKAKADPPNGASWPRSPADIASGSGHTTRPTASGPPDTRWSRPFPDATGIGSSFARSAATPGVFTPSHFAREPNTCSVSIVHRSIGRRTNRSGAGPITTGCTVRGG